MFFLYIAIVREAWSRRILVVCFFVYSPQNVSVCATLVEENKDRYVRRLRRRVSNV